MLQCKEIRYFHGDTQCIGYVAYKKDSGHPKPGIMLAHDWGGRGQDICDKANQMAELGYIGFAIDMYGDAQTGETKEERRSLMYSLLENRKKIADRMLAAYHAFILLPEVNKQKIAVLGYCFGGLCALDLARTGASIQGAVSFHGLLTAPEPAVFEAIQAKILVLHGYDDPLVPPQQIDLFSTEMTQKKADWQIHMYGLTKHSFTNPKANDPEMGLHYDAKADKRSWQSAINFLHEIFLE
ncbi:dienelactone hydrolase family protein [Legionella londiniensis]|uniref:Dienelactone hydrolase family protein n=1 Tax=Legionella londiniensis TaxID=45068 RepID=A0A0W0VPK2_9GAMM|nr:dienelactone hydrolase family protein [Legionella londiniensis]KTD21978.1 dienelactone hydrolase family protein [Legionella londiniensis]STX94020.1 dienelactone hydrolase family protein [Legionella londiniensis]